MVTIASAGTRGGGALTAAYVPEQVQLANVQAKYQGRNKLMSQGEHLFGKISLEKMLPQLASRRALPDVLF